MEKGVNFMVGGDFYQKLALAVYRVTEFFPEKEPLKFHIREQADKILANLVSANPHPENIGNKDDLLKDIKILYGYFDLAGAQNWVDLRNFSVLKREYGRVQELFEKPLGNRQDKILEAVDGNGMVKIGDIIKLLPGVNRRTVLRDLDKLCQTGAMVRNGNGRGAHYVKNGHNHGMSQFIV